MVEGPVGQSKIKWRNITDESAPPCAIGCIIIDIVNSLDHKFAHLPVVGRDIAVIVVTTPLAVEYVDVPVYVHTLQRD